MENIVRLNPLSILRVAERLTWADANGRSVRVCTGRDGKGNAWFKFDAGDGAGWSEPIWGEHF